MVEVTIFEKILSGEIPADVVLEGEGFLAFHDINAQAPVHVLVIPCTKVENLHSLAQLSAEEQLAFLQGIQATVRALGVEDAGYRVVLNSGVDGGQTVNYLHAHILAGRRLTWPPG